MQELPTRRIKVAAGKEQHAVMIEAVQKSASALAEALRANTALRSFASSCGEHCEEAWIPAMWEAPWGL